MALYRQCLEDLNWWLVPENLLKGAPFSGAPPEQTLFTDASRQGWGAHLGTSLASGVWTTEEQGLHINQLEFLAVFRALQKFHQDLLGSVVSIMSDNSTVVAYLRNSGGYSFRVPVSSCRGSSPVVREPFHLIASHVHCNSIVDVLSRECVGSEWTLHPEVCRALFQVWGSPLVDLFAIALTRRLPLYVAPLPD